MIIQLQGIFKYFEMGSFNFFEPGAIIIKVKIAKGSKHFSLCVHEYKSRMLKKKEMSTLKTESWNIQIITIMWV